MSDLISRQAAIDALDTGLWGVEWDKALATAMLKDLPPAQPEEDCDTCKHGYFGDTRCNNCKVRFPSHYERRTNG